VLPERTNKRAPHPLSTRVEALRLHAEGVSRIEVCSRLGIGSRQALGRWFSRDDVLRAAGLTKEASEAIGVRFLGPYDEAAVLPRLNIDQLGGEQDQPDLAPPSVVPVRKSGGRPTVLSDPAKVEQLLEALRVMLPTPLIADLIGVTQQTINNWLRDARAGKDTPGGVIGELILKARSNGIINAHRMILDGDPGAKGAQFLLSRVHKEHYSERIEQAIEYQDPMAEIGDDELDELIRTGGDE